VLEQVLRQGPGGYLLHHQVIVLFVDTERQSQRVESGFTALIMRKDVVWSPSPDLLVEPDICFLQLICFRVRDGVSELPVPLTQHHLHDLHQVRGVFLVVNDANLSAATSFAVPDAASQRETLHKDQQRVSPDADNKFSEPQT